MNEYINLVRQREIGGPTASPPRPPTGSGPPGPCATSAAAAAPCATPATVGWANNYNTVAGNLAEAPGADFTNNTRDVDRVMRDHNRSHTAICAKIGLPYYPNGFDKLAQLVPFMDKLAEVLALHTSGRRDYLLILNTAPEQAAESLHVSVKIPQNIAQAEREKRRRTMISNGDSNMYAEDEQSLYGILNSTMGPNLLATITRNGAKGLSSDPTC